MNAALSGHAPAAARGLSLATYAVLPLSEQVGLIEWVDQTTTLKTLIHDEADRRAAAPLNGGGAGRGGRAPKAPAPSCLAEAQAKYGAIYPRGNVDYIAKLGSVPAASAAAQFDALMAGVPTDLLSRAVGSLSVSAEVYLSMRARFSRSLATLTVCGHILGIGDRHLDNFLLHMPSGRVVGIDFGHAFGSATYMLPVPELMGVRLTRQLTAFLRPLNTGVLLKGHMAHTLAALRAQRADLMRLMEVFLSEPLVDWEAQTRRLDGEQRKLLESDAEANHSSNVPLDLEPSSLASTGTAASWGGPHTADASARKGDGRLTEAWAHERLAVVDARLRGANSARLTLRELACSVNSEVRKSEVYRRLEGVVLGGQDSLRRTLPAEGLSIEQQVDVLVEQASDPNILGRTWIGWAPWI